MHNCLHIPLIVEPEGERFDQAADNVLNAAWDVMENFNPLVGGIKAATGVNPRNGDLLSGRERWAAGAGAVLQTVPGGGGVKFEWKAAGHIFRNSAGHVSPSSMTSKQRFARLFESVANNSSNRNDNILPAAARAAGKQGLTRTFRGGQVWAEVYRGRITNAGVNLPGSYK
jgi:hypothetical protein